MKIFVEFDMDDDKFVLMCDDGRMRPTVAGQRLFRGPPHPQIQFRHASAELAEVDAGKLRSYLAQLSSKKPSKKQRQEFQE
jgi:hypothetical protein